MILATAADTASVRFVPFSAPTAIANKARNAPPAKAFPHQLSDTKQESHVLEVHAPSAKWLHTVLRRINNSIAPVGTKITKDQRWLRQDIADAANNFFRMTSDLLPSEPYIYSSRKGELVAEFTGKHGTMTAIVSEDSAIVFAVGRGAPVEGRLPLGKSKQAALREEVQRLKDMLHTGQHGEVESNG